MGIGVCIEIILTEKLYGDFSVRGSSDVSLCLCPFLHPLSWSLCLLVVW